MPALEPPLCDRCGVPIAADRAATSCSACLRHPPAFASARAAALYRPARPGLNPPRRSPWPSSVSSMRGRRALADALGRAARGALPVRADALLVPVPLHLTRLRERGFNQAVAPRAPPRAARGPAGRGSGPLRTRATQRAGRASRRPPGGTNLAGAFALRPGRASPAATSSSSTTCSPRARRPTPVPGAAAAGAAGVDVYTVGRAPLDARPLRAPGGAKGSPCSPSAC